MSGFLVFNNCFTCGLFAALPILSILFIYCLFLLGVFWQFHHITFGYNWSFTMWLLAFHSYYFNGCLYFILTIYIFGATPVELCLVLLYASNTGCRNSDQFLVSCNFIYLTDLYLICLLNASINGACDQVNILCTSIWCLSNIINLAFLNSLPWSEYMGFGFVWNTYMR